MIGASRAGRAQHNTVRLDRGILCADRSILAIDEVNLLADEIVDAIPTRRQGAVHPSAGA